MRLTPVVGLVPGAELVFESSLLSSDYVGLPFTSDYAPLPRSDPGLNTLAI